MIGPLVNSVVCLGEGLNIINCSGFQAPISTPFDTMITVSL
jgi:hypothetical protein